MTNCRKYEQTNLQLLVNTPGTSNVKLEIGTTVQTVEVSAQSEALNTTDASLGNAFSEYQIKELPLEAGNVPELLSLQAGVAYTGNRPDINKDTDTRSGAVNGARSDQSNITLDASGVNPDLKGYAFTSVLPITPDSAQAFPVTPPNHHTSARPRLSPSTCPGGVDQGLARSYPIIPGAFGLTPAPVKNIDAQGIGLSQNVMIPCLQAFSKLFPNDNSLGDGVNFVGYRFSGPVATNP